MKLTELLSSINPIKVIGPAETDILSLTADSRHAGEGAMFVAMKGVTVDGHTFIPSLEGKGIAALVVEQLPETLWDNTTYVVIENSAVALGHLASCWYGHPSRKLHLIGVTGTNGKTTTATLIYEMARLLGYKAGLLSTVCNYVESTPYHTDHTTPDPLTINEMLRKMADAGCDYCAMEVSSHAAHQHRIAGLHFVGGIFTNLTRDHLDYHKTVEAYLNAKKSFFDMLPKDAFALVNADDKCGRYMVQNTKAKVYTYSLRSDADFRGKVLETRLDGTLMLLNGKEVEVRFTGRFNAYNLTDVYGASILTGFDPEEVIVNMSRLVPVAGRFQSFMSGDGVAAIVDYAHTPDALVNVLDTIREIVGADGNIITVVGAGGNRDHGKRPMMAQEAACRSDYLILTSDNPRDENPEDIIAEMRAGLNRDELERAECITDRREAICKAVVMAKPGSVVLVAGKGHETYQEVKGVRHHFDDREEVKLAFEKR